MSAPACISSAISVGATDDFDNIPSFSNIASFLDLLAPGVNITSSVPGGGTTPYNGTSMATPHVTGAWAVVKSYKPDATIDELLAVFKSTGTLVDDNRLSGTVQNIPRINVDQVISALNAPPVADNDGSPTPLNSAVTINVLVNDLDANNDTLTIDSVGTPSHGTAVQVNSTSIEYTPNTGYSGADSFTYTISDGNGGSATGTVFVIVDGESVFLPVILKN
jgi:subtilisin family serine protease